MPAPAKFTYASDRATAIGTLQRDLSLHVDAERRRRQTYLDTFDWRVHRAGFVLTRTPEEFHLADAATGVTIVRAPASSGDALPLLLHDRLAGAIAPRALLPVAVVESSEVVLSARDGQDKTVVRLLLSDATVDHDGVRTPIPPRLTVLPLRGYDKQAARLTEQITALAGIEPAGSSLFEEAVAVAGRHPRDYASKLSLKLSREQSTYDAARLVYRTLLSSMQVNEPGVADDLDSEFLHDYRVAVRRTRSALKELRGALPEDTERRFRADFRWLGQVTTPTRDLDVYLLDFPAFRAAVGAAGEDLEPLHRLIVSDQRRAHSALRKALRSGRYRRLVADWPQALGGSAGQGPAGGAPIGVTADSRIADVAQRVLRQGDQIDDSSPGEALHDLRKRCKELRYLLEFFASLYDSKQHGALVSALKGLQDNLGAFQDTQVQRHTVEGFADRLVSSGEVPAAALLAVGRLVAVFDEREHRARAEFAERFASYSAPKNRRRLELLTGAAP